MIHCYWLTMLKEIGWSGWSEVSKILLLLPASVKDPNQQFVNCTLFKTSRFSKRHLDFCSRDLRVGTGLRGTANLATDCVGVD